MKKCLVFLLAFAIIICLVSCGGTGKFGAKTSKENHTTVADYSETRKKEELDTENSVVVTDKMVERATTVLDDLVVFLDDIPEETGSDIEPEEGWVISSMTPEQRVASVMDYLHGQQNVAEVWQENESSLGFMTIDGIVCTYTVTQVFDDPELNYAGHGNSVISFNDPSDEELLAEFAVDPDFYLAPIDPDVLVMAPLHHSYDDRKANNSNSIGKELAEFTGGDYLFADNEFKDSQVLNTIHYGKLTDYGTVMLITHSSAWSRGDGTEYILFSVYSGTGKDTAEQVWNGFKNQFKDPQDIQNCLESLTKRKLKAHPQALITFDVTETYKEFMCFKWNRTTRYNISITSNYLMRMYAQKEFPRTVFYFGSCQSGRDSVFNSFLLEHGASAVIAYNHSIQVYCEQSSCKAIFSTMMKKNSKAEKNWETRYNNVSEAVEEGYNIVLEDLAGLSDLYNQAVNGEEASIWAATAGETNFVYKGIGQVKGRITSGDGDPLEGASVTIWQYYDDEMRKVDISESDKDGEFHFSDVPYGMYLLVADMNNTRAWQSFAFAEPEHEENVGLPRSTDYYRTKSEQNTVDTNGDLVPDKDGIDETEESSGLNSDFHDVEDILHGLWIRDNSMRSLYYFDYGKVTPYIRTDPSAPVTDLHYIKQETQGYQIEILDAEEGNGYRIILDNGLEYWLRDEFPDSLACQWYEDGELHYSGSSSYHREKQLTLDDLILDTDSSESSPAEPENEEMGETVEENGFTFVVYSNHARVVGYHVEYFEISVPETVHGVPVTEMERLTSDNIGGDKLKLLAVTLPDTITEIPDKAFYECRKLASVNMPANLQRIGEQAFWTCAIETVSIPESVTEIGLAAFSSCWNLKSAILPESITELPSYAFSNCTQLKSVWMPSGLEKIGKYCFYDCYELSEIELPESVKVIGSYAFTECKKISGFDLSHVEYIGGFGTFNQCKCLTEINLTSLKEFVNDINDDSMSFGNGTFWSCTGVTKVDTGDNIVVIPECAFRKCSALTDLRIGNSVKIIEKEAFYVCEVLESVKIPDSVKTIEETAFSACPHLTLIGGNVVKEYVEKYNKNHQHYYDTQINYEEG